MKTPKLVVLDFDGTLIRLGVEWEALRTRLEHDLAARGLTFNGRILATLHELEARGEHAAALACGRIAAEAERRAAETSPVNRALLRWLDEVVPQARLGILTLNDRSAALAALPRLSLAARLAAEHVLGRGDAPPKPSPEGLTRLLAEHRLSPSQAVFIGDSEIDHHCGRAASVATIDVAEIGVEWEDAADEL